MATSVTFNANALVKFLFNVEGNERNLLALKGATEVRLKVALETAAAAGSNMFLAVLLSLLILRRGGTVRYRGGQVDYWKRWLPKDRFDSDLWAELYLLQGALSQEKRWLNELPKGGKIRVTNLEGTGMSYPTIGSLLEDVRDLVQEGTISVRSKNLDFSGVTERNWLAILLPLLSELFREVNGAFLWNGHNFEDLITGRNAREEDRMTLVNCAPGDIAIGSEARGYMFLTTVVFRNTGADNHSFIKGASTDEFVRLWRKLYDGCPAPIRLSKETAAPMPLVIPEVPPLPGIFTMIAQFAEAHLGLKQTRESLVAAQEHQAALAEAEAEAHAKRGAVNALQEQLERITAELSAAREELATAEGVVSELLGVEAPVTDFNSTLEAYTVRLGVFNRLVRTGQEFAGPLTADTRQDSTRIEATSGTA